MIVRRMQARVVVHIVRGISFEVDGRKGNHASYTHFTTWQLMLLACSGASLTCRELLPHCRCVGQPYSLVSKGGLPPRGAIALHSRLAWRQRAVTINIAATMRVGESFPGLGKVLEDKNKSKLVKPHLQSIECNTLKISFFFQSLLPFSSGCQNFISGY